jgi:hypothetical protein
MYGLSYLWHGVVLNDIDSITYPIGLFYFLSAIVYLFIGFVLTITTIKLDFKDQKYLNGTIIGSVLGFFLYLIAFILGVSFSSLDQIDHLVFDILWQMLEQGLGGMLAGSLYAFYKNLDKVKAIG